MQNDLAMADLLQNILDDEAVVDLTLFRSGDSYCAKTYLLVDNKSISVEGTGTSVSEMIMDLHTRIQNAAERN